MTELTRQQASTARDTPAGGAARVKGAGSGGRRDWLVLVGPAVVALVSYLYRLGGPPLWRDEATTKDMSGRSVHQILTTLRHYDAVHGAYYLFMHFAEKVIGNSDAALRLPSALAMVLACAFTALTARRLAAMAGEPRPWFTGAAAGLALALLPGAVRYAQEARPYAIVTMGAAIATYLLLRAAEAGGLWWAWYGMTVAALGVVNIFGLLILLAHGLTLLIAGPAGAAGHHGRRARPPRHAWLPVGWLAAGVFALAAASPVLRAAYTQRAALTWKTAAPVGQAVVHLIRFWAGSGGMAVLGTALVLVAVAAAGHSAWTRYGRRSGRWPSGLGKRPLGIADVAVPLLVGPAAVLLAVSQAVPVYDNRYVEFCLPALAMLIGGGLGCLWRLGGAATQRRARIGLLPVLAASAALLALGVHGSALVRQPGARGDDLELATQVIADNAKTGDIVLFVPISYRTVALPFPQPWQELRDIALRHSPAASNTLYGTDVTPAQLRARFKHVGRVWLIAPPPANRAVLVGRSALYAAEWRLVAGLRVIHRWVDHDVIITLYTAWHPRTAVPAGGASG